MNFFWSDSQTETSQWAWLPEWLNTAVCDPGWPMLAILETLEDMDEQKIHKDS